MSEDTAKIEKLRNTLAAAVRRKKFRAIDFFQPYDKQREFFSNGAKFRERLLMAGNQLGKSEAGAAECAYHLTGEYPDDWTGRRFDHPVTAWAAGETSLIVRDVQQKKLCGKPGVDDEFGTGMIPKERFKGKPSLARGVTDAFDTIQVEHRTNGKLDGTSTLTFKSYEQGRTKFQGATLDFVWFDEEPDEDIYSEGLTRTVATKGMVFMTFTPLKGMSAVVSRFINEPSPERRVTIMVIEDAKHISAEERDKIIAGYLPHEREARARGVPMLGSGKIFQVTEESIMEPPLTHIPMHWAKLWGIDFGIAHPFGAVLMLWDKDNDVIHIHATIRVSDQGPLQHAVPMLQIGAAVPVAWPQDGTARESNTKPLSDQYRAQKLLMIGTHATWPDGGVSTEAGVLEMGERMKTGRLKVANHLSDWFEEFRMYHRKNGLIVKERDDLLSATRIAIMMKRYARVVHLGNKLVKNGAKVAIADGVDFDPF